MKQNTLYIYSINNLNHNDDACLKPNYDINYQVKEIDLKKKIDQCLFSEYYKNTYCISFEEKKLYIINENYEKVENEFNGDFGQIHKFEKFNDTIFYMISVYKDGNNAQNNVNIGVTVLSVEKNKLEIKKNQKFLIQQGVNTNHLNALKVTDKSIMIDYSSSGRFLNYLDISTLNSLYIGNIPGNYYFDLFSNNLIFVSNFISKFPRPTCHDYKINLVCDSSVSIGINKSLLKFFL